MFILILNSVLEEDDCPFLETSGENKRVSRENRSFFTSTGLQITDTGRRMMEEHHEKMKSKCDKNLIFVAKAAVKSEGRPKAESKRPPSKKPEVVDLSESTSAKEKLMAWTVGKPEEVILAFAVSLQNSFVDDVDNVDDTNFSLVSFANL